jgi:hypothetical protein
MIQAPHEKVQVFVAELAAYRRNRGSNEVAAKEHAGAARASLTPRLSSSVTDIEQLGVYPDAGPGDEDGWPEPIRGMGDDKRYVITVAFDSDAGEVAHGAGGAGGTISQVMEFEFAPIDGQWKIDAIRRVGSTPGAEDSPQDGEIVAPTATSTSTR